jgi:hypothetical protein
MPAKPLSPGPRNAVETGSRQKAPGNITSRRICTMMDFAFAALLDGRIGRRWRHRAEIARLDNHLRRDIGLPPLPASATTLPHRF